ncbi:MAG: MBL fold metallo-hydrolase [Candidatus Doudnabacteria bacterium]|nr:MBL fold metallo-hydrolase [Candidatus Doudnabacteria bacterium]
MTITWFGLSSFKLVGRDITIITDPFGNKTGLSPVRGAADVVILSNPELDWSNNLSSISGTPFIVSGPGEYDIKGTLIMGSPAQNQELGKNTIYSIELEDVRIAFFGAFNQEQLTDDQKQTLEGADIVLIPVGGKQVLDSEHASKIATQLEPYYIVPHSYKTEGLTLNLDKLDNFIKEMGGKPTETDKISVKKKDFTAETTSVMVLAPQR